MTSDTTDTDNSPHETDSEGDDHAHHHGGDGLSHDHGEGGHSHHEEDGHSHNHGEGDHSHNHGKEEHTHEGKDHPHHELAEVAFAVVTVTTSRTLETDKSGDALVELIKDDGQEVTARELVGDDREAIAATVEALVEREDVDAILLTGGTGLSPEDVTVEAVRPLFDQEIPGFGELFRYLSYEDIGPRALLSRAFAGSRDGVAIFCLPGSEQGATFGTEQLILPTVAHILGHTQDH